MARLATRGLALFAVLNGAQASSVAATKMPATVNMTVYGGNTVSAAPPPPTDDIWRTDKKVHKKRVKKGVVKSTKIPY